MINNSHQVNQKVFMEYIQGDYTGNLYYLCEKNSVDMNSFDRWLRSNKVRFAKWREVCDTHTEQEKAKNLKGSK